MNVAICCEKIADAFGESKFLVAFSYKNIFAVFFCVFNGLVKTSDRFCVLNKNISFTPIFIECLPEDTCNNKLLFSQSKNFRPQFEKGERVDFSCCLRNHLIDWMFFFLRKMKQQKFQLRLKNLRWKKDWTGEVPFFSVISKQMLFVL